MALFTYTVSEFHVSPATFLNANIFKEMMVPPKLDIVDSTPGAEIYAIKIKLGKKVNILSNVSLNT